jgi:hypothetical protein
MTEKELMDEQSRMIKREVKELTERIFNSEMNVTGFERRLIDLGFEVNCCQYELSLFQQEIRTIATMSDVKPEIIEDNTTYEKAEKHRKNIENSVAEMKKTIEKLENLLDYI